jgi:hypothetical protein
MKVVFITRPKDRSVGSGTFSDNSFLDCDVVSSSRSLPTFRRNLLHLSSVWKSKLNVGVAWIWECSSK